MNRFGGPFMAVVPFWVAVVAVGLWLRPILPVDETRYTAVAWDMWRTGNWLVPHLNGETYSHKPPLLFWLINLGWSIAGVSETWARLVAPLAALASAAMTILVSLRLWPNGRAIATSAGLVMMGTLSWSLFGSLTFFDTLLTLATLVSLYGLLIAGQSNAVRGFLIFGAGIGLGVLAKGPAILVHTLPAALLAPLWVASGSFRPAGFSWPKWYRGVALGFLLGVAIGLAWAIPAGLAGGAEYRQAIFWGQSAGRMVESFAHQRPWWWYAAILPLLSLPWIFWPPAWRALASSASALRDGGIRFCLCWALPAIVVFSLISGKQPHYLLPEIPAFALGLAFLLHSRAASDRARSTDGWIPAALFAAIGLALVILPLIGRIAHVNAYVAAASPLGGIIVLVAGLALAIAKGSDAPAGRPARIAGLTAVTSALIIGIHVTLTPVLERFYDLRPIAERAAQWQGEQTALAYVGTYHGEFAFLGRLSAPVQEIGLIDGDIARWIAQHPDGVVIARRYNAPSERTPLFIQPFRTQFLAAWTAEQVRDNPEIVLRHAAD